MFSFISVKLSAIKAVNKIFLCVFFAILFAGNDSCFVFLVIYETEVDRFIPFNFPFAQNTKTEIKFLHPTKVRISVLMFHFQRHSSYSSVCSFRSPSYYP